MTQVAEYPQAPIYRRVLAMIYDFSLASVLVTFLSAVFIMTALFIKTRLDGAEIDPVTSEPLLLYSADSLGAEIVFVAQLFLGFAYLWYFWRKNGRTLGNRAWKIQTLSHDMSGLSLFQAFVRFTALLSVMAGCFAIGYFLLFNGSIFGSIAMLLLGLWLTSAWAYFDPNKRMLHEALSKTMSIDIRTP